MSEDVSSFTRLGVTVTLMAAVVSLVLSLMVMLFHVLGINQEKYTKVITLGEVQEYESFNNTQVSGSMVKAVIDVYARRDLAVVVRTQACIKGTSGAPSGGYNYGCVLKSATTKSESSGTVWVHASQLPKATHAECRVTEYHLVSNAVVQSTNTKGINTSGSTQFILDSALFKSELIKNKTGTIIGIVFEQIS